MTGYQAELLKKTSNSGIFLINYPAFLSSFACLSIGVNQEVEGTTLHKEKKNVKKTMEATARTKNIFHSQENKVYRNVTVWLAFFF